MLLVVVIYYIVDDIAVVTLWGLQLTVLHLIPDVGALTVLRVEAVVVEGYPVL